MLEPQRSIIYSSKLAALLNSTQQTQHDVAVSSSPAPFSVQGGAAALVVEIRQDLKDLRQTSDRPQTDLKQTSNRPQTDLKQTSGTFIFYLHCPAVSRDIFNIGLKSQKMIRTVFKHVPQNVSPLSLPLRVLTSAGPVVNGQ